MSGTGKTWGHEWDSLKVGSEWDWEKVGQGKGGHDPTGKIL